MQIVEVLITMSRKLLRCLLQRHANFWGVYYNVMQNETDYVSINLQF